MDERIPITAAAPWAESRVRLQRPDQPSGRGRGDLAGAKAESRR